MCFNSVACQGAWLGAGCPLCPCLPVLVRVLVRPCVRQIPPCVCACLSVTDFVLVLLSVPVRVCVRELALLSLSLSSSACPCPCLSVGLSLIHPRVCPCVPVRLSLSPSPCRTDRRCVLVSVQQPFEVLSLCVSSLRGVHL